jgi:hypothetical protein
MELISDTLLFHFFLSVNKRIPIRRISSDYYRRRGIEDKGE